MGRFTGLLGLVLLISLAWAFSSNRKRINWRTVGTGITLQFLFALIVLKWTPGQRAIAAAGRGAEKLLSYAYWGSSFVFGNIGNPSSPLSSAASAFSLSQLGFSFAFQVLPAIIFIAALFA